MEILCLLGIGVFLWAFICSRIRQSMQTIGNTLLISFWMGVVLYVTLFGRVPAEEPAAPSLLPFSQLLSVLGGANPETLRTAFMNGVLFFPGGLFTAGILPVRRPLLGIAAVGAVFSVLIETVQWIMARGVMETDDVLANTLGALAGGLVSLWIQQYTAGKNNEEISGDVPDTGGNYGKV